MARYLTLRLPFGLVPTEAAIGGYRHDHSVRALHRVYSVGATFGCEKRCFHRYETGMKPEESLAPHGLQVAANYRPTGMKPVVAKHKKECFRAFQRPLAIHHSITPHPKPSTTPIQRGST